MELQQAQTIAEKVLADCRPACSRIEVAGSVRRKKPLVKDIEIVAIVEDYESLFKSLACHGRFIKPGVPDIIDWSPKEGAKYIRMLLEEQVKLDFFVASPENWGALLTMRTGPAAAENGFGFVPAMFAAWKRKSGGGKMSGCLPTFPDGRQVEAREEKEFFDLCGVKWVDPEERRSGRDVKKLSA